MKRIYTQLFSLLFLMSGMSLLGQEVMISQYVETDSGTEPKGIEVWNNTGSNIDFSSTNLVINQGTNGSLCSSEVTLSSGTLVDGEVWVIGTTDLVTYAINNGQNLSGTTAHGFTFNGNDALTVELDGSVVDQFGMCQQDPSSAWEGNGVSTQDQNIQILSSITSGNPSGFTDPSTRFETVSTTPSGTNGLEGFGDKSPPPANTIVSFASPSTTVNEGDGTFQLCASISNPDGNNETTIDIAITGGTGNASDVDNYSTQTLTFPAGSSTDECITVTITDDSETEGNENVIFSLQNITGGNNAMLGSPSDFDLTINDNDLPQIVINEFLPDPDSDVNNDGTMNTSDDEFIEIYNNGSTTIDLTDWVIEDGIGVTHIFPSTTLDAGVGLLVFGGGSPTGFAVETQTASSGELSLNNSGDNIILKDDTGIEIENITYPTSNNDVSFGRSPDFTGDFVDHNDISSMVNYSPGLENVDLTPLPVQWVDFTAIKDENSAVLNWSTTEEANNEFFEVQHSIDGEKWNVLAQLEPYNSQSRSFNEYEYIHNNIEQGNNFYRIRQVDQDGAEDFSVIRAVFQESIDGEFKVFPNPATSQVFISEGDHDIKRLHIINSNGSTVRVLENIGNRISISDLHSGVYFLKAQTDMGVETLRFIKQ